MPATTAVTIISRLGSLPYVSTTPSATTTTRHRVAILTSHAVEGLKDQEPQQEAKKLARNFSV